MHDILSFMALLASFSVVTTEFESGGFGGFVRVRVRVRAKLFLTRVNSNPSPNLDHNLEDLESLGILDIKVGARDEIDPNPNS
jgi:hypothetical protein